MLTYSILCNCGRINFCDSCKCYPNIKGTPEIGNRKDDVTSGEDRSKKER